MNMELNIVTGTNFNKYLDDVIRIDAVTLPKKYVTSIEKLRERYNANKDSFIGVVHNDILIGYFNFFPINSETLDNIIDGKIDNDVFLGKKDILKYSQKTPFDIYIITIAILPKWQNKLVVLKLQDEFKIFIKNKISQKFLINKIYASVVSDDGDRLLRRMSFVPTDMNRSCYFTTIERFLSV